MLGVIPGLIRPGFLVEVEVVAALPAGEGLSGPVRLPPGRPPVSAQAYRRQLCDVCQTTARKALT
jgi:hypothetical protein